MPRTTSLLMMIASLPLTGMSCEPPLVCGNPLDAGSFGFVIQLPAGIDCDASLPSPNEIIRGLVAYRVSGTDTQIVVLVADASQSGDLVDVGGTSQGDCNDLGDYVNGNGVTFERCMFTNDQGVSYSGFAAIPGTDNRLLISVIADADDASFGGLLESVLDGVSFAQ